MFSMSNITLFGPRTTYNGLYDIMGLTLNVYIGRIIPPQGGGQVECSRVVLHIEI